MESEQTAKRAYMSPTSPEWIAYYKRAKETRRLGKGQHDRLKTESKRRRRRENIIALASTAVLVAIVAIAAALLGGTAAPESDSGAAPRSLTADVRRG